MNINDRDLGIIGAGAFLTVLCLLFKWPFVARIVVGLLILVVFTAYALWRIGPDRITIEEYLARQFGKNTRPRKFSFRIPQKRESAAPQAATVFTQPVPAQVVTLPDPPPADDAMPAPAPKEAAPTYSLVTLAWEEVGIYRLVTVWLVVIGIYFIYWLSQGGTAQIGNWMKTILRFP